MSIRVWLAANTFLYPEGGGHLWVYLNWALGLRSLGCDVIWLEGVEPGLSAEQVQWHAAGLKSRLSRYGLGDKIALCSKNCEPLPADATSGYLDANAASGADLLLNVSYETYPQLAGSFRRSALIDIDPGLLQIWITQQDVQLERHDAYFTIGETVGRPGSRIPTGGFQWNYTPPCVALDWWPVCATADSASYTTVSHWFSGHWIEFDGESYDNDKRTGFLPFLDLPQRTVQPLELAICLGTDAERCLEPGEDEEASLLKERGWRVRHAYDVGSTPWDYQAYIQQSRGEFSCVKPSCIHLQNAWVSDRTLCYLASGKPAIIQHTGPSRFLPDAAGLFRFRDMEEAVRCLDAAAADYDHHCRLARALAEEYFDARKVAGKVLERALA